MRIYRKLFVYLKPHLGLMGVASIFMVASSLLKGVSLGMLVPLVDFVLLNRPPALPQGLPPFLVSLVQGFVSLSPFQKLHWIVAGTAVLFLLKNLVLFFQTYLMNDVAMRFLRDIRNGLYRKYQTLSLDFFSGERTGELVSRITFDVAVIQNTIIEGITDIIYQSAQVVVFASLLIAIDWRLSLVALILLPAIAWPILRIGKALRKLAFLVQERMADLNSRLIETVQGIRIIKAFTAEEAEAKRFGGINEQYYRANLKTVKRREALAGVTELIGMAGGLVVLELGGLAVFRGELSPGTFVLFLGSLLSLYQPFKRLSRLHAINQEALAAANRVMTVLEAPPSVKELPEAAQMPRFKREVRYQEVWFKYQDRFVLCGIDLAVRAGEVVAIVGPSGSGKTTLVNLISRFYDPSRGRILIDGVEVKSVTLDSLRHQIGLVTQDPFLFHDTVHANIAFGNPKAGREEVIRAAAAANADGFIAKLPLGYDTPVGELGARLSGGERQRLSIARALLKDPPILILDEATSQLDSESEALVQEALERLMEGRTVLVISHRLSTIRNADRIIVLDQGKIAEVGRHEELISASPVYRRLYELQVAPG